MKTFYHGFSFGLLQLVSHGNHADLVTFPVPLSVSEYVFNHFRMNHMISEEFDRGETVSKNNCFSAVSMKISSQVETNDPLSTIP